VIDDPQVADMLIPTDHPRPTKRICTDTNLLSDVQPAARELGQCPQAPIESIDATGGQTPPMRTTTLT